MKYLLLFAVVGLASLTFALPSPAQASDDGSKQFSMGDTKVTLTIENTVVTAILYSNTAAEALKARLPLTVSLNRGPVDYCGGIDPLSYGEDDVQAGYRSGDLAYWIPGQDFVIFTEMKNTSSGSPDLIIVGRISSDINEIRDLGSTINVTIALD